MSLGKICIIEDEVDIVEALTLFLSDKDYEVISFNSANEFYKPSQCRSANRAGQRRRSLYR